ncbi:hypothetical protein D3C85_1437800 [compost metagenome]
MVNVQEQDRQHPALVGLLDEFFGEDLIETPTIEQVGQGIVVCHLLQRHTGLVELAEQGVDPLQVMVLVLEFFVGECCADAAADDQQCHHRYRQRQLYMTVVTRRRQGAIDGQYQFEGGHRREMHAEDARPEYQAGAVFEELVEHAGTVAQVPGQQQCRQGGGNGDQDGKGE